MTETGVYEHIIAGLVQIVEEVSVSLSDEYGGHHVSPEDAVKWAVGNDWGEDRGLYATYLAAKNHLLGTQPGKDHVPSEPQREN